MLVRTCLSLAAGALLGAPAWSCSCQFGGPAACQAFHDASTVFVGAPTRVSEVAQPQGAVRLEYTFRVERVLNGSAVAELKVTSGFGGGDCGYRFQIGETYVVYAMVSESTGGRLHTSICTRTRPLRRAAEDLAYSQSLQNGSAESFIAGVASNWNGGGRLGGVSISLEGPGGPYRTRTQADGSFRFDDLPPGQYSVSGALDRHVDRTFRREAKLASGGCRKLGVQLAPDLAISGVVTGPDGAPIQGLTIRALSTDDAPEQSSVLASAETDEQGRYMLTELQPGHAYVIGVNFQFAPREEGPYYPRTFYPGVADRDKALLVPLGGPGSRVEGIDFQMPAPYERRTIRGRLMWPDGSPAEGVHVSAFDPRYESYGGPSAQTDAEGRFRIRAYYGIRYFLVAAAVDPAGVNRCLPPVPVGPGVDGDGSERALVMGRTDGTCRRDGLDAVP